MEREFGGLEVELVDPSLLINQLALAKDSVFKMYIRGLSSKTYVSDVHEVLTELGVQKPGEIKQLSDKDGRRLFMATIASTKKLDVLDKGKWPTGLHMRPFHEEQRTGKAFRTRH